MHLDRSTFTFNAPYSTRADIRDQDLVLEKKSHSLFIKISVEIVSY